MYFPIEKKTLDTDISWCSSPIAYRFSTVVNIRKLHFRLFSVSDSLHFVLPIRRFLLLLSIVFTSFQFLKGWQWSCFLSPLSLFVVHFLYLHSAPICDYSAFLWFLLLFLANSNKKKNLCTCFLFFFTLLINSTFSSFFFLFLRIPIRLFHLFILRL